MPSVILLWHVVHGSPLPPSQHLLRVCTHAHRCKLLCASAGSRGTRGRGAICAADGALPVPPLCSSCNTFTILSILATMPSLPWASAARSLGAHTAALDPAIAPLTRFPRMQEAKAILDAACGTREVRCPEHG